MLRIAHLRLFVVPLLLGSATSPCRGQDPAELLDHYRLLPRLSTLHKSPTVGEGPEFLYHLIGKYDLQHSSATPKASFENAEIWASQISDLPTPAIVLDVDRLLNLEGLRGEALPVAAPFDVYQFKGEASNGSAVNLFAAVLGPWMYVRGGTEPEGATDLAIYRVQWLARSRPFADLNEDGVVDTADYVMLRHAASSGGEIGYADWAQQFGETVPDLSALDSMITFATTSLAAAGVPEPAAVSLAILAGILVAGLVRRRAV